MKVLNGAMLLAALGLLAGQGQAATAEPKAEETAATAAVEAAPVAAASTADDAFSFFLQEAEVVTASRRAQKKSDSPVAIDVITREEIQRSGARSIQDLLRFRVGVDVVEGNSIEGNPAQVNVRGLPEEFSQSLQVLIDGRSQVSMTNSGVYWRRLPVAIDDIERIEIVRGPNSALFGANAGQGVINIITIKPGNGSNQYKAEAGSLSFRHGHMAMETGGSSLSVRGSYDQGGKASSFNDVAEQPSSGNRTDNEIKMNVRAVGRPWDGGELDFAAGTMLIKYSYPVALGVGGDTTAENDYQSLKLMHSLSEDLSLEGSAWRREDKNSSTLGGAKETVYDGDLTLRASLLDGKSQTTLGVSGRYGQVEAAGLFSNTTAGNTLYEYTRSSAEVIRIQHQRRAYLSEQIALADWISVALAGSYEGSDTGGEQPAYQGAVILKPMDDSSLRISGSKSPTMPSLLNKYARLELITGFSMPYAALFPAPISFVPRLATIRVEGTDITPPQVASYESTFSTSFLERKVSFEVTAFQMEISGYPEFTDQGGYLFLAANGFVPEKEGYITYFRNTTDLVLRGAETSITYKPKLGTMIHVNHTYEDVSSNKPVSRYAYTTPWNKVNGILSQDLGFGINIAGAIGWQGAHSATLPSKGLTANIPDQAKLDLRLGYSPWKDVELYVAGSDLAHQFRQEAPDGMMVTQSYAGGMNVVWGGSQK